MNASVKPTTSQLTMVVVILILEGAALAYHLLVRHHLEQTSALFIGLPAILAIALSLAPHSKTALGMAMKGTTLAILMSGVLLGEGFICILLASPLFYLVAAIIGALIDHAKKTRNRSYCLALLPLLPMCFEGVTEKLSFPRDETVVVEKEVAASASDVELTLSRLPRVDKPLPFFLRLGFPRAVETDGCGLNRGDRRRIHFAGGEGKPGDLLLGVAESDPGRVEFHVLSDQSKIAHWLEWKESIVSWSPAGEGRTRVTWTLRYRRLLDPAWYFGPWERYGVRLAGEVLIDSLATPP
jgi:hypothetical protein